MKMSYDVTRRQALGLGIAAAMGGLAVSARASSPRPVVIELFTSQGCSSCPPADAFVEELRAMPGVIALTINVDYWDYLGWHDTLADKAHSQRQYDYARSRGDMDVYTPQMVIDGAAHYAGSNKSAIRTAVKQAQAAAPSLWVPLALVSDGKEAVVEVAGSENAPESTVWLMSVTPRLTVKIDRGENAGREITYYNVVRKLLPAGIWKGNAATFRLPKSSFQVPDCRTCVALLQMGDVGPVIGAASLARTGA